MTPGEIEGFEGVLNELLSANKDRFVRDLFNKRLDIGSISIKSDIGNEYTLMYDLSLTAEHAIFQQPVQVMC